MIDTKKVIASAGYVATPELEAAVSSEIERLAANPAMVDKLFKRLFRQKSKRTNKTAKSEV